MGFGFKLKQDKEVESKTKDSAQDNNDKNSTVKIGIALEMEIRKRVENTRNIEAELDDRFFRKQIFNILFPGFCLLCLSSSVESASNYKVLCGWPFTAIKEREEIPPLMKHGHDLHEVKTTHMELIQEGRAESQR